jgi:hypothetical protein
MPSFPRTLAALGSPALNEILRDEINALDSTLLPLQQGLTRSSHALPGFTARLLDVEPGPGILRVKAGLLYAGIIAGCSCADDPTPVDEITEYCVVRFDIDTASGEAGVTLIEE